MSGRLIKGMYGSEFSNTGDLFGITCGQIRSQDMVHNGGWFNRSGEKLGWGDLSPDDFRCIRSGLQEDEVFLVLSERASFWDFVQRPGLLGRNAVVKPDEEAPGADYVAEKCMYIITREKIYCVHDHGEVEEEETSSPYHDRTLTFHVVTRDGAKALLRG